jgi:hypothetical protein
LSVRATGHPVWNRARTTAAGHAPEARAPPAARSAPWRLCCPCKLTKTRLICSKPRPRSLSPLHTHHLSLYSAAELPRSSAPGTDELPIQAGCCCPRVPHVAAEQILPSPERIDGWCPPVSSPLPPSIAARTSRGTAESGHGTGALRPPRAPSSHHSTRQLHQPHRMTHSPSFHRHQGAPPWTDLPMSPRPPPTPQIGPPLRHGASRPVSPPPRAASDRNQRPPSQAGLQGQFGWPM